MTSVNLPKLARRPTAPGTQQALARLEEEVESASGRACLAAALDAELSQDRRDVMGDGPLGDKQALGYLGVPKPVCDERQDFELAQG